MIEANDRGPNALTKTLAFGVVLAVATGLSLIFKPALVVKQLLGVDASGMEMVIARCFGIGLFGLSFACWPDTQKSVSTTAAFRGMLIYCALIAAYLGYLGTVGHLGGMLLWPAAVLHAVVAGTMLRSMRIKSPTAEVEE
jgi:uncharacterized membrane protein